MKNIRCSFGVKKFKKNHCVFYLHLKFFYLIVKQKVDFKKRLLEHYNQMYLKLNFIKIQLYNRCL